MMGGNGSYPDLLWGTKLVTQISGISSPTDTFSSDVQNPKHGTFPNPCLGGQDVSNHLPTRMILQSRSPRFPSW